MFKDDPYYKGQRIEPKHLLFGNGWRIPEKVFFPSQKLWDRLMYWSIKKPKPGSPQKAFDKWEAEGLKIDAEYNRLEEKYKKLKPEIEDYNNSTTRSFRVQTYGEYKTSRYDPLFKQHQEKWEEAKSQMWFILIFGTPFIALFCWWWIKSGDQARIDAERDFYRTTSIVGNDANPATPPAAADGSHHLDEISYLNPKLTPDVQRVIALANRDSLFANIEEAAARDKGYPRQMTARIDNDTLWLYAVHFSKPRNVELTYEQMRDQFEACGFASVRCAETPGSRSCYTIYTANGLGIKMQKKPETGWDRYKRKHPGASAKGKDGRVHYKYSGSAEDDDNDNDIDLDEVREELRNELQ